VELHDPKNAVLFDAMLQGDLALEELLRQASKFQDTLDLYALARQTYKPRLVVPWVVQHVPYSMGPEADRRVQQDLVRFQAALAPDVRCRLPLGVGDARVYRARGPGEQIDGLVLIDPRGVAFGWCGVNLRYSRWEFRWEAHTVHNLANLFLDPDRVQYLGGPGFALFGRAGELRNSTITMLGVLPKSTQEAVTGVCIQQLKRRYHRKV
jgi:hypothetical protein